MSKNRSPALGGGNSSNPRFGSGSSTFQVCVPERAASLVAELNGLGHDAEMVAGEKSQFDVVADGETVWSKQQVGRCPELADLLAVLK